MPISITPIYAVLLTVIYIILFMRVVVERRANRFAYGDNNSPRVHAKIRASANWSEHVPITLILFLLVEVQGAPAVLLHGFGMSLVIARGLHGYSMSFAPKTIRLRVWGMSIHFLIMVALLITLAANWF